MQTLTFLAFQIFYMHNKGREGKRQKSIIGLLLNNSFKIILMAVSCNRVNVSAALPPLAFSAQCKFRVR